MKDHFRIACIQTHPFPCEQEKNIRGMERSFENVMAQHPDTKLIVFPELATSGYECEAAFESLAETKEGPSAKRIGGLAKKYGVYVVYGLPLRDEDGLLYNSQLLLGPDGAVVGHYHKVHLFDTEKKWFHHGSEFPVYETELGRIGMLICYDLLFPETSRCLTLNGAELLVHSTAWEDPYLSDLVRLLPARALESVSYIASCNRVGTDNTLTFSGLSRIVDPRGNVIAATAEGEADYCSAEVFASVENGYRHGYYTMLEERFPLYYNVLVKQ